MELKFYSSALQWTNKISKSIYLINVWLLWNYRCQIFFFILEKKKKKKMSLWRHCEKSAVSPSHPTPRAKCSKRKSSWGLFLKLTPYVLDYACLSGTIVICNTSVFFLNFQLAIKICFRSFLTLWFLSLKQTKLEL